MANASKPPPQRAGAMTRGSGATVSMGFAIRVASRFGSAAKVAPHALGRLLALALPRKCLLCGLSCGTMPQGPFCPACDAAYWNESRLRCTVCALPLPGPRARHAAGSRFRCAACTRTPPPFDATLALADYRPPLERLALGLKFHARLAVAREFGRRLARLADDNPACTPVPDILVPMPLAHARLVARGFNQAWEIARPLARLLGVAADPTLIRRVTETAPQSRLDREARRRNVAHAFRVNQAVRALHVGLVDDVMTSGATLEAAAHALKRAGARRVTNFVALRTPQD